MLSKCDEDRRPQSRRWSFVRRLHLGSAAIRPEAAEHETFNGSAGAEFRRNWALLKLGRDMSAECGR